MSNALTPEQRLKWDAEMQERVFGAAPIDDYNFKTRTFPKYTTDAERARELVEHINQSRRYRVDVSPSALGADTNEWSVEVRAVNGDERLSSCRGTAEAQVICEAIMTADVKL